MNESMNGSGGGAEPSRKELNAAAWRRKEDITTVAATARLLHVATETAQDPMTIDAVRWLCLVAGSAVFRLGLDDMTPRAQVPAELLQEWDHLALIIGVLCGTFGDVDTLIEQCREWGTWDEREGR